MDREFLSGYITLADGEKDPRNLLLAFSIDRVICIEFDISRYIDVTVPSFLHLALTNICCSYHQDMFNVTFCYFPITFKPPPDDPYGITPDELKLSLRYESLP